MEVTKLQPYAAVMGDLVSSERSLERREHAQPIEQIYWHFNSAIDGCNHKHGRQLASPLTITLGDEFQGLATSLTAALPLVRDLRFDLMSADIECRFAIGVVELRTPLNPERAWNMMGPGLSRTRDKLNEKRAASLYRFAVTDDSVLETTLEALGAGLTSIERRWTGQQRSDIVALLAGASAKDLARRRNVSVHSIYKVRSSGDFETYVMLWDAIEQALARIDAAAGMAG